MQKLKRKCVKLLLICTFSVSCGSMPQKPQIEICGHDQPNREAECVDNQTGQARTLGIDETDKYIMMSDDDWGLVLYYIDQLRRRIRSKNVRTELKKIIKTSSELNEKYKSNYSSLF